MACTRSTCRRDLKRKRYCCTRSSSRTHGSRGNRQAPPVPSTLPKSSQPYCDGSNIEVGMLDPAFMEGSQPHCDWSNIGFDELEQVYKFLPLADILICAAVCSLWRSVSQTYIQSSVNSSTILPPILWFHYPEERYWLLDMAKVNVGRLYSPNHEWEELLNQMGNCVGYSLGYFLVLQENKEKKTMCLLHPLFPSSTFRLPLLSAPWTNCIRKAALWADPIMNSSSGVVIVHYYHRQLMFAKCGATQFSELEGQDPNRSIGGCTEIICINNCIYAISPHLHSHHMEAWDCCNCGTSGPRKILDFKPTFSSGHIPSFRCSFHLVEARGELFLVAIKRVSRVKGFRNKVTSDGAKFKPSCMVYKMDFKEKEWVHVDSLGDLVLFVFEYQTMSLSVREFPQYQKNSIYFLHHFAEAGIDENRLGIFNMEDGFTTRMKIKRR